MLAIWPPDGKVSNTNIHHNVAQAMSLVHGLANPVLIVIGAEIAAGTQTAVDNQTWQVPTIRVLPHEYWPHEQRNRNQEGRRKREL